MIDTAARDARVVVLNARYTAEQADALRAKVECVVGMDGAIGDDAARAFAIRFYGALGNRRSIGNAVKQGVAALAAKQLPDEVLPRCLTRNGLDADAIFLEQRASVSAPNVTASPTPSVSPPASTHMVAGPISHPLYTVVLEGVVDGNAVMISIFNLSAYPCNVSKIEAVKIYTFMTHGFRPVLATVGAREPTPRITLKADPQDIFRKPVKYMDSTSAISYNVYSNLFRNNETIPVSANSSESLLIQFGTYTDNQSTWYSSEDTICGFIDIITTFIDPFGNAYDIRFDSIIEVACVGEYKPRFVTRCFLHPRYSIEAFEALAVLRRAVADRIGDVPSGEIAARGAPTKAATAATAPGTYPKDPASAAARARPPC